VTSKNGSRAMSFFDVLTSALSEKITGIIESSSQLYLLLLRTLSEGYNMNEGCFIYLRNGELSVNEYL
jgi:hypothetical protein